MRMRMAGAQTGKGIQPLNDIAKSAMLYDKNSW